MLALSCHDRASHALSLEGLDQLGQLAQREPVNSRRALIFDLRECFLFDRCHDNLVALRARRIQHQKRKSSVTRDQAEFEAAPHYLITPRSDDSMNRISKST